MSQFARPGADTLVDNWITGLGGSSNLYAQLDEVSADNGDFVQSQLTPTSDVYVLKFNGVLDPLSSTGHIIRYRYGKDVAGGDQINFTAVEFRQGYVNEGSKGTLIKSWSHTNVAGGFVTATQTLSGGEADSITDYGNLYLRFEVTKV